MGDNFADGSSKQDLELGCIGFHYPGILTSTGPENTYDKPTRLGVGHVSNEHIPESLNVEVFLVNGLGDLGDKWALRAFRAIQVL
jgi:hypothetical protein